MFALIVPLSYLIAAVCFIFALRGLSHPERARHGLLFGMAGMAIAVAATFLSPRMETWALPVIGIIIGGGIGTTIARRVEMTALPQLMAAFHSLVGLSAVCVAAS